MWSKSCLRIIKATPWNKASSIRCQGNQQLLWAQFSEDFWWWVWPGNEALGGGCGLGMRPLGGGCGLGMRPLGGGCGKGRRPLSGGCGLEGDHLARLHTVMASVWLHCRDQSTVGGGCLKMSHGCILQCSQYDHFHLCRLVLRSKATYTLKLPVSPSQDKHQCLATSILWPVG